jgi:hypothetical protein
MHRPIAFLNGMVYPNSGFPFTCFHHLPSP